MSTTDTSALPDYAPVPRSALGPALNEQGYYVGRVERNLYWVTDGTYQSAFLTTSDGVVLVDAGRARSVASHGASRTGARPLPVADAPHHESLAPHVTAHCPSGSVRSSLSGYDSAVGRSGREAIVGVGGDRSCALNM
jgi:hypothetical protein